MEGKLYKLFCLSERQVVRKWATSPPTQCPNNSTHKIELDSVREDEKFEGIVKASENSDGDFETTHITMQIPPGNVGDVSEHDVNWPMDILLWVTYLTPNNDMIGDEITVLADPERQVGGIIAPVNVGDTVLHVDPGAFAHIQRGYLVTLNDGSNKDVLGRIVALDSAAGTVTVENPTSFAFSPGTQFQRSVYVLKDIYVFTTETVRIGEKGFKGKLVPSGVNLRVCYKNNTGTAKTFRWRPEYYNMG